MKYTRNQFLKLTGLAVPGAITVAGAGSFINSPSVNDVKLNLALASYTLRSFSLDDTIKMTLRLGLTNISLKSMHMPLESNAEDIKKMAEKVRSAGLNLYGAGVIYMKTAQEVETVFAIFFISSALLSNGMCIDFKEMLVRPSLSVILMVSSRLKLRSV